jgi:hypothetical protein
MIVFFLLVILLYILYRYKQKNTELFELTETPNNSINLVVQLSGNDVVFYWDTKDFYNYFTLHIQPPKLDQNLLSEANKKKYLQSNKFVKLINSDKNQIFFNKIIVNTTIDPDSTYVVKGYRLNENGSISKSTSNSVNNSKIPIIPKEVINISFPVCEIDGSYKIVQGDPSNYVQELGPNLDIPSYLNDLLEKLNKNKNQYDVEL